MVERVNNLEATRAILMNEAVSAVISKAGSSNFKKRIKDLTSE